MQTIVSLQNPFAARALLAGDKCGAVQIDRPALDALPYNTFVQALLRRPGFKLDFRGQAPATVMAMVADRLIGPDAFADERALLAGDIVQLAEFARALIPGAPPPQISIRTYFAPGDVVWHVDRVAEANAFRLLWPIGRATGMRVTPRDTIDHGMFTGFMRREHPLLCALDTAVLAQGADVETLWTHRPRQLEAMRSGDFPFLHDPSHVEEVAPGAASVHRVETPSTPGTFHRSCWSNRDAPGFQIVITVAG